MTNVWVTRKKRKSGGKRKESLKDHFSRRWRERVCKDTPPPFKKLNNIIKSGNTNKVEGITPIGRQSHSRSLFLYLFKDQPLVIVYNKNLNSVCTVLPADNKYVKKGVKL